jgi:hypothetical protein
MMSQASGSPSVQRHCMRKRAQMRTIATKNSPISTLSCLLACFHALIRTRYLCERLVRRVSLMAGGTSRSNHSEVGSSFVHFNFTPRQDKATPSLFGDVPGGVLLDRLPIFLGGQGGVAGPVRMAYGTILAAGSICRKDVLAPGTIIQPPAPDIPLRREARGPGRRAQGERARTAPA